MRIKKAREFAEEYRADPTNDVLLGIIDAFLEEIKMLADARHIQSISALCSILKEQDRKWKAFVGLAGDSDIRPDGFKRILLARLPQLYYHCWAPPPALHSRPISRRKL